MILMGDMTGRTISGRRLDGSAVSNAMGGFAREIQKLEGAEAAASRAGSFQRTE